MDSLALETEGCGLEAAIGGCLADLAFMVSIRATINAAKMTTSQNKILPMLISPDSE